MRIFDLTFKLQERLREVSPYDTGNLNKEGIYPKQFAPNKMGVVIGGIKAPYAPYLEYGTKYSKRHVGWGKATAMSFAEEIAKELGGTIQ